LQKEYNKNMSNILATFSGFSVKNLKDAEDFYVVTLGLSRTNNTMGLELELPGGGKVFIYEKADHEPAKFTVLNFVVADIDATVDDFRSKGIVFEHYDLGNGVVQDDKEILRGLAANMGPDIAWFKDPSGNILSVIQDH
jgi:catechol 2,3-dioxygenase-like lactoylglutathione lyase family enzyme